MDKYSPAALVLGGVALGATVALAVQTLNSERRRRSSPAMKEDIRNGLEECIGNTPLIRIRSLSEATGCDILGKAEVSPLSRSSPVWALTCAQFLEPGGSVKDRVALKLIQTVSEPANSSAPSSNPPA
ncbi:Cysteine synthase 2 [Maublancomyces gigas]|uniref:Cysteine synthase 2 n=1 Tax=Discina gigas TaxID=1032678 RepID=A0ABR3GB66_9PEZI